MLNDDPAYNPQLSRDGVPYSGLAWPPGRRIPDTIGRRARAICRWDFDATLGLS